MTLRNINLGLSDIAGASGSVNQLLSTSLTAAHDTTARAKERYISGYDNTIPSFPIPIYSTRDVWVGSLHGFNNNGFVASSYYNQVFSPYSNGNSNQTRWFGIDSLLGTSPDMDFIDASGRKRVVSALLWGSTSYAGAHDFVLLVMDSPNVPNSNTNFTNLVIGSSSFQRSQATYIANMGNNKSAWWWNVNDSVIGSLGVSGNITKDIRIRSNSYNFNDGISVECGGNDNNNVQMTDYYRNGTYNIANSSVPSSGEIKVSDFHNLTYTTGKLHETNIRPSYFTHNTQNVGYAYGSGASYSQGVIYGRKNNSTITSRHFNPVNFGGISTNQCQLDTTVFLATNTTNVECFHLQISNTGGTGNFVNDSGFSFIEIYRNQSNDSGTPDMVLPREQAFFDRSGSLASWTWRVSGTFSNYLGTNTNQSGNPTHHLVLYK